MLGSPGVTGETTGPNAPGPQERRCRISTQNLKALGI